MAQLQPGFNPDYDGIGDMLRADWMADAMLGYVRKAKTRAEAIAPVGDPASDPHAGEYKTSFRIEAERRGGAKKDRAEATLLNVADHAIQVEKGNSRQEGQHVLMRAIVESE